MSGKRSERNRSTSRSPDGGGSGPRARGLSTGWTWALVLAGVAAFGAFMFEPLWRPVLFTPPSPAVLAAEGASVYRDNCATCHGAAAEGQDPVQRMGGQRADGSYIAPALNGTAHAWHHPPDQLFRIVKFGSPAPDSPMRGFSGRLSDRQIEAALAYVQSLWPETLRRRYREMHRQG